MSECLVVAWRPQSPQMFSIFTYSWKSGHPATVGLRPQRENVSGLRSCKRRTSYVEVLAIKDCSVLLGPGPFPEPRTTCLLGLETRFTCSLQAELSNVLSLQTAASVGEEKTLLETFGHHWEALWESNLESLLGLHPHSATHWLCDIGEVTLSL